MTINIANASVSSRLRTGAAHNARLIMATWGTSPDSVFPSFSCG